MKLNNRRFGALAALAVAAVVAAGCSAPDAGTDEADANTGSSSSSGSSSDTLKLGVLAPVTGNLAAAGGDMVNGWKLYWEENGDTFAGTKVEYKIEDTAGDPATALSKVDRLVGSYGAEAVVGPILANVALAVSDDLVHRGVPSIQSSTAADDLTQRLYDPLVARPGGSSSSQSQHPAGEWAFEQGYKTAVTLCPDYAFGYENCGGFARTFKESGGEIVKQLWSPLGTKDFSTYVTQIKAADPDVVYVASTGGDAPTFIKTWSEFGLKGKIPFIGNSTILEQSVLRSLGDEALGLKTFAYYAEGRTEGTTPDFVAAFEKAHDEIPSVYAASGYAAAQWIAEALKKADGDIGTGTEIIDAIEAVEVDTPLGPMTLDDHNNPVENVYLREVQRRDDGTLWNVPLKTYEDVSQFWTYDPDEFLESPVYSRDFQG